MFATRLRIERESLGLKQKEMADKLNIPANTYNGYETGKRSPSLEVTKEIADFLEVSVDYLLGRTDERKSKKEINNATTIAAHRLGDVEQLPDDAIDEINNYIDLMRLKYLKDKK
ncbi:MAG: helix-turn-helix transcriptional regulator [Terrisporobacter othiniensis]|uniref:helix-turn-helix domain-containing protein n=1 Tax=Terrisporobacter petrolearius TaxID=1460447 RepID=UPI0011DDB49F|nr:helix-turn-helix transcriptional regulator [Terrisporobacter othiniensis]MDU6996688.1 helix-turn-helix transcriptional regulator [Terrisporobacter othiniensis]UPA31866.1 helix-turn-helix transcriptional regulator [Terrisporobacter glycolicus]